MSLFQQLLVAGWNGESYIPTPAATPSFGAAFEGGFYAGLIWNELVQSSTSTVIGTGTKVFDVPDMLLSPLVYVGQSIEVRSRANPDNKMMGQVTKASGTVLTLYISSVGGSGTFSDWSIMSRYRVIVAPKFYGESASLMNKNAQTGAPACNTLTEGRKATLAMVAAGDSSVYPAAHWCNNLNIDGKVDWYLPARDELELCWRNLKPTAGSNYTVADMETAYGLSYENLGAYGDIVPTHGRNFNSYPSGAAYTASVPAQVAAGVNFRTGESQAFGGSYYISSSEYATGKCWIQSWSTGAQNNAAKTQTGYVRAVRRSII